VHINSSIGSASSADFAVDRNNHLNFHVGDTCQCHNVTIHNDDICEWNNGLNENFFLGLRYISGSNIGTTTAVGIIEIDDANETECSKSSFLVVVE